MGSGHFVRHGLCLQGALSIRNLRLPGRKHWGVMQGNVTENASLGVSEVLLVGINLSWDNPGKLQGGGRACLERNEWQSGLAEKQGRGRSEYSELCCHCQRPFEGLALGMAGRQDELEMQCVCFLGAPNRDEHQGCRRKCSCCEMPKMINPCAKVEAELSGYDFMVRASLSPRCPRRRSVLGHVWSSPIHWVEHSLQPQH